MKRLLAVIGCVLLLSGVAFADAKFFWRQSAAGLSSILGMATNDYAIVAASDNTVCFYKYSGTAWDNVGCIGPSLLWNNIIGKPTTATGYGIVSIDGIGIGSVTPASAVFTDILVGSVNNTEFGYLNGATSNIQTQLNTKSPSTSPTFTGTVVLPTTTSIGSVSSTEIGYVDGVTSAIQTQINGKANSFTSFPYDNLTGSPTLGTIVTLNKGTMTNLKYCTYSTSTGGIGCESDGGGGGGGSTTSLPWDNITARPTFFGSDLEGAALDNVSKYPSTLARLASPTFSGTVVIPTPFTLGATSVTSTGAELNHSVGVTSAIQTQLNAKVAAASPTITGTATIAKVVIAGTGGGTIDNTVIGATTPLAGTFTTGTFTTLTVGPVDNTEMGYLDGATSNLQTQMDLKAPKASPSFTGNATFAAEVTATQYNSSGADGTHYVNVLNQATPSDVTRGNCYLDNTTLVIKCSDGATYAGYSGTVTPSTTDTFTNKTLDAAATGNVLKQLKYYVSAFPNFAKGTGAVYDNVYKQVTLSNSTDKAENCAVWYTTVPEDIDTSVDLAAKFKFGLNGADTAAHNYVILMKSSADSALEPTDYADQGNEVSFPAKSDASGAQYDIETVGFTTLTNWKSNLTAGDLWSIFVCRDGDADASTVDSYSVAITIRYGSTQ